jgi:hypothetical protein
LIRNASLWNFVARLPLPLHGAGLHRLGLWALHAECAGAADRIFERAAAGYRAELEVEALARLRVHQHIARLRENGSRDPDAMLDVERRLYRLATIESLHPPFACVDAGRLLASWSQVQTPAPQRTTPTLTLVAPRSRPRA